MQRSLSFWMNSETKDPSRAKYSKSEQGQGAVSKIMESVRNNECLFYYRIRPGVLIFRSINRFPVFAESVYTVFIHYFLRCLQMRKTKEHHSVEKPRAKVIVITPQFQNCLWIHDWQLLYLYQTHNSVVIVEKQRRN